MKTILVVSAFLMMAACGKKDGKGGGSDDPAAKLMADYGAIKDKLCACTDKDCTTKLKADADALEQHARDALPNPTKEQKDEFRGLEHQVNECARKF